MKSFRIVSKSGCKLLPKGKEKVKELELLLLFIFKMKLSIYFPFTTNPIKKIFPTKNFVI